MNAHLRVEAVEVAAERLALDREPAKGGKGARQHGEEAADALDRLLQQVRDLPLAELDGGEEGAVRALDAQLARERADVRVALEVLARELERRGERARPRVEEDAVLGLDQVRERVKVPAVRVELALVLRFRGEDDLLVRCGGGVGVGGVVVRESGFKALVLGFRTRV